VVAKIRQTHASPFCQNTLVVTPAKAIGIERFGSRDLRRTCAKPSQWSINAIIFGRFGCAESFRKLFVKMGKEHLNKSTVVNGICLLR
jgi:hypothetical protein